MPQAFYVLAGHELLLGSIQARVAITLRAFPLAHPGLPGVYCLPWQGIIRLCTIAAAAEHRGRGRMHSPECGLGKHKKWSNIGFKLGSTWDSTWI